jgi:hypothetical protein
MRICINWQHEYHPDLFELGIFEVEKYHTFFKDFLALKTLCGDNHNEVIYLLSKKYDIDCDYDNYDYDIMFDEVRRVNIEDSIKEFEPIFKEHRNEVKKYFKEEISHYFGGTIFHYGTIAYLKNERFLNN